MVNPVKWLVPFLLLAIGLMLITFVVQYDVPHRTKVGAVMFAFGLGLCLLSVPLSFELGKRAALADIQSTATPKAGNRTNDA